MIWGQWDYQLSWVLIPSNMNDTISECGKKKRTNNKNKANKNTFHGIYLTYSGHLKSRFIQSFGSIRDSIGIRSPPLVKILLAFVCAPSSNLPNVYANTRMNQSSRR